MPECMPCVFGTAKGDQNCAQVLYRPSEAHGNSLELSILIAAMNPLQLMNRSGSAVLTLALTIAYSCTSATVSPTVSTLAGGTIKLLPVRPYICW